MSYIQYSESRAGSQFLSRVFGWMAAGLAISGATAYALGTSSYIAKLTPGLMMMLMLIQFGLVVMLSAFAQQLSYAGAVLGFGTYAFTTGITSSVIFLVYTHESIFQVFGIAAMFAVMALYGYFTNTDLSSMGNMLFMGLIGLIIASLVNIFVASAQLNLFIAAVAVLIFTLLTAYDVQRIKMVGMQMMSQGYPMHVISIVCALVLYLDFINLFFSLLQLFGKRRD